MCIVCFSTISQLNTLTKLDCNGCTNLTSLPQLKNLTYLNCDGCINLTSLPHLENLTILECSRCASLTSLPILKNLTYLICDECTNLTSIPLFEKLTYLNCNWCTNLISIFMREKTISQFNILTEFYCGGCINLIILPQFKNLVNFYSWYWCCRWLNHKKNTNYCNNINKLKTIQRWWLKNKKYRNFIKYIKSKEFNEWFYHPNGIGGKIYKRNMLTFLHSI